MALGTSNYLTKNAGIFPFLVLGFTKAFPLLGILDPVLASITLNTIILGSTVNTVHELIAILTLIVIVLESIWFAITYSMVLVECSVWIDTGVTKRPILTTSETVVYFRATRLALSSIKPESSIALAFIFCINDEVSVCITTCASINVFTFNTASKF